MKNSISLSTALVRRLDDTADSQIERLRPLNPEGMEIRFETPKELLSFNPAGEMVRYLKSLEHGVSIHAAWLWDMRNDPIRDEVFERISDLCDILGTDRVIVRNAPANDFNPFRETWLRVMIENTDCKNIRTGTLIAVGSVLNRNLDVGFSFHLGNALSFWTDTARDFVTTFKDRIDQVHLSYLPEWWKAEHSFLHQRKSDAWITTLLQYFKKRIRQPLVLGCIIQTPEEIDFVREEVYFLRDF